MFRTLLATTALASLIATAAFGQTQPPPAEPTAPSTEQAAPPVAAANAYLASNLMGENVYNGTGDDAAKIGDVNDLVLDTDGNVTSIIVGVGGFLGIGEKNVALEYDKIEWAEKDGDRWIVVAATKDELNALPVFDRTPYQSTAAEAPDATAPASTTKPGSTTAPAPVATDNNTTGPAETTSTAKVDKATLKEIPGGSFRSEDLVGTIVYGANDERVGEVGDIVLDEDKKADSIIIDVGGFLGMGEKQVALGTDNLVFLTDDGGTRYLYTNFTKEQLESQPAYEENTYKDNRDKQRLTMRP